jgi:hypothetical protein
VGGRSQRTPIDELKKGGQMRDSVRLLFFFFFFFFFFCSFSCSSK